MYYGAIINGTNTLTAYKGILGAEVTVEPPAVRTVSITIPGRNGVIDATGAVGTSYGNRKISFTILFPANLTSSQISTAKSAADSLHGTVVTLTLPDDTSHYYKGRISIKQKVHFAAHQWDCEMDAEPTVYTVTSNGG